MIPIYNDGFQGAPTVTSMCPAVAVGLELAQNGQLDEDTAQIIRKISDIMTDLAREERNERLAELDRLIAGAKASGRKERE